MKHWNKRIENILQSWMNRLERRLANDQPLGNKYVAYCDLLGFSNAVLTNFNKTAEVYKEFREQVSGRNLLFDLQVSIYSDSIIIVGDNLIPVAQATQLLQMTTLSHGWLVRGGIAYGKHWKESNFNNLFIVSEALVKAVNIEKTVKHPIVAIDSDIPLGLGYFGLGFRHRLFDLPIIHYKGQNIVNPFNNYYFKSAKITINNLKLQFPDHHIKHEYLLQLIADINSDYTFIPQNIIDELIRDKLIEPLR